DPSNIVLGHVTKEGVRIERHYEFLKNATIKEQLRIKNLATEPLKLELVLNSVGMDEKGAEPGIMNPGVQSDTIVVKAQDKHERITPNDVLDKPKSFNAPT